MPESVHEPLDPQQAAERLSAALEEKQCDYALGGAVRGRGWRSYEIV